MEIVKLKGVLLAFCFLTSSCDYLAKRRCEWYIMPDPEAKALVESGWATVCIRNYELNRQQCYLKLKLDEAEATYGKAYRYVDFTFDRQPGDIKEITGYKECQTDKTFED